MVPGDGEAHGLEAEAHGGPFLEVEAHGDHPPVDPLPVHHRHRPLGVPVRAEPGHD